MLHVWYIYLQLGHVWGKCRDSYSSTMVRIWDLVYPMKCRSPAVLLSNAFIAALCHLETPPLGQWHLFVWETFGVACASQVYADIRLDQLDIYAPEEDCTCFDIVDILLVRDC